MSIRSQISRVAPNHNPTIVNSGVSCTICVAREYCFGYGTVCSSRRALPTPFLHVLQTELHFLFRTNISTAHLTFSRILGRQGCRLRSIRHFSHRYSEFIARVRRAYDTTGPAYVVCVIGSFLVSPGCNFELENDVSNSNVIATTDFQTNLNFFMHTSLYVHFLQLFMLTPRCLKSRTNRISLRLLRP